MSKRRRLEDDVGEPPPELATGGGEAPSPPPAVPPSAVSGGVGGEPPPELATGGGEAPSPLPSVVGDDRAALEEADIKDFHLALDELRKLWGCGVCGELKSSGLFPKAAENEGARRPRAGRPRRYHPDDDIFNVVGGAIVAPRTVRDDGSVRVCDTCLNHLRARRRPPRAHRFPDPDERLTQLTVLERQLIRPIVCFSKVQRVFQSSDGQLMTTVRISYHRIFCPVVSFLPHHSLSCGTWQIRDFRMLMVYVPTARGTLLIFTIPLGRSSNVYPGSWKIRMWYL